MNPLLLLLFAQGEALSAGDIRGEWINERRTAIVSVADCASGLCGTIVWSAPIARRDAARGGTTFLNGVTVVTGIVPTPAQHWRGSLFLPDQNRIVRAKIELNPMGELRIRGCELAGLLCRTQTWSRWAAK